jgi:rubrerythrin
MASRKQPESSKEPAPPSGGDGEPTAAAQEAAGDADDLLDEEEDLEGEEEEAAELIALAALAQMDFEAAVAYAVAADSIPDREVSKQLLEFRADHLRHVEDLDRLASDMGGELTERIDASDSMIANLAVAAAALGESSAMFAMISNEKLTNSTYESILRLDWDEEVREVLTRNFQDEQRHLRWLEKNSARVVRAAELPGAPP